MVRDYELMYIVRPELDDEALQAATASVEQLVTGAGGAVTQTTSWGRRRLAYEVKHLRDGHYMLLQLRLEGAQVAGIERALTISETVFRHLLVVQEAPVEVDARDASAESGEGSPAAATEAAGAPAAGGEESPEGSRQPAVAATGDDGAVQDADGGNDDDNDEAEPPAAEVAGAPVPVEEEH